MTLFQCKQTKNLHCGHTAQSLHLTSAHTANHIIVYTRMLLLVLQKYSNSHEELPLLTECTSRPLMSLRKASGQPLDVQ